MKNRDFEIIDFHAHIYPAKIGEKAVQAIGQFYDLGMVGGSGTAAELVRCGAEIGVSRYVVCSAATTPAQVTAINDFICAECREYPQFVGLGTLHPYMEGIEAEIDRIEALGLHGIKLHPDFQEFDIDDPKAMEMYRIVGDRLPILFHMGDKKRAFSKPVRLRRVRDAVPGLCMIGAHYGGYSAWDEAEKYLLGQDIYMDTSSSLFELDAAWAADFMRAHGMEKFFFGTDYPMWDHAEELKRFMALPLADDDRAAVLAGNVKRFFGIAD